MPEPLTNDADFLAARLHARRSRLAERERLDQLCGVRTVPELAHTVFPHADALTAAAFQRRVVEEIACELALAAKFVGGPAHEVLLGLLLRFQLENLKILLRGVLNHLPRAAVEQHLLSLPAPSSLDAGALLATDHLNALGQMLPRGVLRELLRRSARRWPDPPPLFLLEAALDQGYFAELIERARRLSGEDRALALPVLEQEANAFLLGLVMRGRFTYGLNPEWLLSFHIPGGGVSRARLRQMLAAPDPATVAGLALDHFLDDLPATPKPGETNAPADEAGWEARATQRLLRLANRAFRRSHTGCAAIVGYAVIRRIEAANLITLSEAIRAEMSPEAIRARMIPRYSPEVARA